MIAEETDQAAESSAGGDASPLPRAPVAAALLRAAQFSHSVRGVPTFSQARTSPKPRSKAFFSSFAAHFVLIFLIAAGFFDIPPETAYPQPERQYTFRVLHLTPPNVVVASTPVPRSAGARRARAAGSGARAGRASQTAATAKVQLQTPAEEPAAVAKRIERRPFTSPPHPPPGRPEQAVVRVEDPPVLTPENIIKVLPAVLRDPVKLPARPFVPPPRASEKNLAIARPAVDLVPPELQTEIVRLLATLDAPLPAFEQAVPPRSGQATTGNLSSIADIPAPPGALFLGPLLNQFAGLKGPGSGLNGFGPGLSFGPGLNNFGAAPNVGPGTAAGPGASAGDAASGLGVSGGGLNDRGGAGSGAPGGRLGPASPGVDGPSGEVVRITRSPNGRHSTVVFGAAAAESHPESAPVLKGKIVYTVYLQVGLPRNWILLFFQPGAEQRGGVWTRVAPLDPPYPYVIVRPPTGRLAGDYTLVHGVVNTEGRFEQLALIVPDEGAKDQILDPLLQWEFRPARKDGVPTPVEILLIIPHPRG